MDFNIEKIKKYKMLIGSLALACILSILIAIGLVSSYKKYVNQKNELKQMIETYEQLVRRQPYPSEKNLAILSSNIVELAQHFNNLNDELRSGEIQFKPMSNTEFMRLLEHKLSILRTTMERKGIKLPEKYAFGFEKYAGGQLPTPQEVPRLMQQLMMIEKICLLLTDANIKELLSVGREIFEVGIEPTTPKRGRGRTEEAPSQQEHKQVTKSTSLYTNETFKISFRCTESSLINFLNKLASNPTFMRIKSVEVQNMRKDFNLQNTPMPKTDNTASTNIYFSRAIVIGREELEAKVEIDVYSFAPSFDEEEIMRMAGKPVKKKK